MVRGNFTAQNGIYKIQVHLLLSALVMLTSSLLQNLKKGARALIVHSPLSILLPSLLGTSCSISELRHDDESSP